MGFTLQKKPGSPYFYAYFRHPCPITGKPVQVSKSTKEKTKTAAWQKAIEIEEATRAKAGASSEINAALYEILKRSCEDATRLELNQVKATEYLSEMLEVVSGKPLNVATVEGWFNRWLENRKPAVSEGTFARYQSNIKAFLKFLPAEIRTGNISQLTSEDILAFRQNEIDAGMTGRAINTKLSPVRQACGQAFKDRFINYDPSVSVEKLPEGDSIKTVIPTEDLRRILATATDEWKGMVLVGYFVGTHIKDTSSLTWGKVDLTGQEIEYKRTKNGRPVKAPIHSELLNWLLSRPVPDDPNAPVFPSLYGVSVASSIGLCAQFAAIVKEAGVVGEVLEPTLEGGKGRKRHSIGFGSLRHSFNSAMANAGIPQEIRKKLTGQSTNSANDIYTHFELETLKGAVNTVPSISMNSQNT